MTLGWKVVHVSRMGSGISLGWEVVNVSRMRSGACNHHHYVTIAWLFLFFSVSLWILNGQFRPQNGVNISLHGHFQPPASFTHHF
jgi:hypothetical protein